MDKDIIETIFDAISDVNKQLPRKSRVEKSTNTILMGESAQLDSLGFINFIIAIEEHIEKKFNKSLNLTEMFETPDYDNSITIGNFSDYISKLLEPKLNE